MQKHHPGSPIWAKGAKEAAGQEVEKKKLSAAGNL